MQQPLHLLSRVALQKRVIKIFKLWNKLYINYLTILFAAVVVFFRQEEVVIIAYLSIMVHELFHYFGFLSLDVPIERIIILPFGMTIEVKDGNIKDPTQEIVISLLGPIANLILIICATVLNEHFPGYDAFIHIFISTNWCIFAINIFPALPLDGGRVLKAYLTEKWGIIKAYNFVRKVTVVSIVILSVIGILVIYITKFNVSYVFIACVLIYSLICEDKNMLMYSAKEMVYSKQKLLSEGIIRSTNLVITKDTPLYKLINMLSYNYFYLINVVDTKEVRVLKTYTEPQVVDLLIKFGNKVKFSDILS